jgi:hypothetical protein
MEFTTDFFMRINDILLYTNSFLFLLAAFFYYGAYSNLRKTTLHHSLKNAFKLVSVIGMSACILYAFVIFRLDSSIGTSEMLFEMNVFDGFLHMALDYMILIFMFVTSQAMCAISKWIPNAPSLTRRRWYDENHEGINTSNGMQRAKGQ